MTMAEVLDKVLGPYGALVLALVALVWVVRTWRADVARLTTEIIAQREARLRETRELHELRVTDAKLNTEALQAVNDRMHDAVTRLWQMWRASQGKTVPPPT